MFLRLLLAFLAFGVLTSGLVGVFLSRSLTEILPIVLVAGILAIGPAWYFARGFVKPFREIRQGAEKIARGEYDQRVQGGVWRESRALALSFNEMSTRLAEQIDRLDTERQHLLAILGGMAEGVVAVGPGQRVLFANEAAGKMLEFNPTAAIGRPLYEMTRQPAVQALLERGLIEGQPLRQEMEFKKPTQRFLKVYIAPLAATSGAILVLDDNSELRRLERLRQDFVANVSHELKTPLAVMKACVETLQDGAVEDPEARGPFLQQIADGGERLHALILDLLSLARIESGEEILEFEALPVNEMVQSCLHRHRPRAEAKGMTFIAIGSALEVWADQEALAEILDNLVDNAVKYSPEQGVLRLEWEAVNDQVRLRVIDKGPGIPDRDLSRIFERFYRVDKARSRELGGTGLGLSIVKHLAQAMKGSVQAASQLGEGSTFTLTLPRPTASQV